MLGITTFLGIFNDEAEAAQVPEAKPRVQLNPEEEFFLQQLRELGIMRVLPKFTPDGILFGELEPLHTYYNQRQMRVLLESLAEKGHVKKTNFGTVALCPSCFSPVVMILLSCPMCGSLKIRKKEVIKHKACGYAGYAEDYLDGIESRCPQCGAVYDPSVRDEPDVLDKAGFSVGESTYECERCASVTNKPAVTYNCVKCKTKFVAHDIVFENPKGYEVIEPKPAAVKAPATRAAPPIQLKEIEKLPEPPSTPKRIPESEPDPIQETALAEPVPEPEPYTAQEEPVFEEPPSIDVTEEPEPPQIVEPYEVPEPPQSEENFEDTEQLRGIEPVEEAEQPQDVGYIEEAEPVTEPTPDVVTEEPQEPEEDEETPEKPKKEGFFSKLLPKKKPRPKQAEKQLHVEREVVRRRETSILLITQEEETANKVVSSLERTKLPSVEVRHAYTGRLGLKELRRRYDAIIIDTELDDVEAKDILSEIIRWNIEAPVIVMCEEERRGIYKAMKLRSVEFIDYSDSSMKQIPIIVTQFMG
ncbi:hypothetical protein JXL21_13510 [Candidatus Bathyarchaeota archaeon]|nr:hypothetical protein [Candidatus Bathyarchaeota archaeon]